MDYWKKSPNAQPEAEIGWRAICEIKLWLCPYVVHLWIFRKHWMFNLKWEGFFLIDESYLHIRSVTVITVATDLVWDCSRLQFLIKWSKFHPEWLLQSPPFFNMYISLSVNDCSGHGQRQLIMINLCVHLRIVGTQRPSEFSLQYSIYVRIFVRLRTYCYVTLRVHTPFKLKVRANFTGSRFCLRTKAFDRSLHRFQRSSINL